MPTNMIVSYAYTVEIATSRIYEIDKKLCAFLQISPKSYISIDSLYDKENAASFRSILRDLKPGLPFLWEAKLKDSKGNLHFFHHYLQLHPDGNFVSIMAIPQAFKSSPKINLSEVNQTIQKRYNVLEKQADALSYSCEMAKIGHWTLNLATLQLSLSKEKCTLLGIPFEGKILHYYKIELMEYAQKYVLPDDIPLIQQNLQTVIENTHIPNFSHQFEYRFEHPTTKEIRHILVKCNFWVEGVLHGVSQDITELKKTEAEVERLAVYKNIIFENSKDAILLFNKDGMIDCNQACLNMFLFKDKSELIGKLISDFSPEYQPDGELSLGKVHQIFKNFKESKHLFFEWQHRRSDNSLFFVEVSVILVEVYGEELELVSLRDVTERKKIIEDLTTQIQNAEQFTYIVSHNLRSPIARILGLTESLTDNDTPEWRDFVIKNLQKDAQQLNQLTIDLNTILNLKKEKGNYNEEVSIPDVLVDSIEMLKDMISEQEANILVDIQCDKPVEGVKEYVKSVFHNLISNAIKYRHPNRQPEIRIKVNSEEDKCVIWVEDNGLGIDLEKHHDKVFGLYKRFHPFIQGRGVGLHITKTQVEMMGGKISLESKVNEGTKFKIVLNMA